MRVYLASSPADLRRLTAGDRLDDTVGFAVTDDFREAVGSEDAEELEFVAMGAAAGLSLRNGHVEGGNRRMVLAVDVPDELVLPTPDGEPGQVRVAGGVALSDVASVHVDPSDVPPDDDADASALQWYATQEIPALLA